ncbi:MAG: MFS transporter [Chitinophagaceae bacterium]|nr:MFS transporter [Chitinophagaceae bacterium]
MDVTILQVENLHYITPKKILTSPRWHRLIPVVFITYSLAYLDRANFAFGVAGGMGKDLNISPATSALLSSLFFLGYFFFQIPGAHYAVKKSAKKLVFWSLILWGACATATGIITNVTGLIIIRFTLGIVESAVMPAMLIFLSRWYTKKERSRANAFLILGNPVTILWMSILSGYLLDAFGWRWMFILEGVPAIAWAFVWWYIAEDHPENAKWLPDEEKQFLKTELQKEQQGIAPVKNYMAMFKSKTVILLSLQYFMWSIGVYGFVMWLPSIIKSAPSLDIVATGWFSSVPYVFAVIGMLAASYFSDKISRRKEFVWPLLLAGALAFYGSYLAGADNFWLSFVLLVIAGMMMYAPYGPFFAIIPEVLPQNVAGVAMAMINSFGALGSFAGAYIVGRLNESTGGFGASYIFMAAALLLSSILTLIAVKVKRV